MLGRCHQWKGSECIEGAGMAPAAREEAAMRRAWRMTCCRQRQQGGHMKADLSQAWLRESGRMKRETKREAQGCRPGSGRVAE